MATLTLTNSNWDVGQIRVTYTASNGTLKITEIEGKRTDGYSSYNEVDTVITVIVNNTSKSISLSHYVDFGNDEWTTWGATDTSWTGLSGTSIGVEIKMPSGTMPYSGYTFTGNITMSWSRYTISYDANGGIGAPSSQTKTYDATLTLSSTKPTRTGYTFKEWNTLIDGSGTVYEAGGNYTDNSNIVLYAMWNELAGFKDKVITIGSLEALHEYNKEAYAANSATGLANLFADGETVLSSHQYGDELPEAGTVGRIFFKRLIEE